MALGRGYQDYCDDVSRRAREMPPKPNWFKRHWADTNQWDLVIASAMVVLMGLGLWKLVEVSVLLTMWVSR